MATLRELTKWIEDTGSICVIPHVSPDGDCLGSALAMAVALERLGKRAVVAMNDPVPEMYRFLPAQEMIAKPDELPFEPEGLLFVDVAAKDRAGDGGALSGRIGNWAIMDHHETNAGFADVNCIDGQAPATGVIVSRLLDELGVEVDSLLATLLYVAISTDTGNFSFPNTTSEAFIIASKLLKTGFDMANVNRLVFRLRTLPRVRLLGEAINAMRLYLGGRVAVTYMDKDMFQRCGANHEHAEGIVNILSDMEGVEVAMTVESRDDGRATKFSMRSNTDFDVSAIANFFHGGGHKSAAGMNLNLPVDVAGPMALNAVIEALEG